MKIAYIYDDEIVRVFEGATAMQQLIAAFNAGQIDDEGYLQMGGEQDWAVRYYDRKGQAGDGGSYDTLQEAIDALRGRSQGHG